MTLPRPFPNDSTAPLDVLPTSRSFKTPAPTSRRSHRTLISHLCQSCGRDLARVKSRREPHYGLPLVICPDCGAASVRRMHPVSRGWRSLRRLATTLLALALQLGAMFGLGAATLATCISIPDELTGYLWAPHAQRAFSGVLSGDRVEIALRFAFMFGMLPLVLGTWLTAGLHHLPRRAVWIGWAAVVLVFLAADTVLGPAFVNATQWTGLAGGATVVAWESFVIRVSILAAILVIAVAGIPLGLVLLRLHEETRRWIWRGRRRRVRAGRAAAW